MGRLINDRSETFPHNGIVLIEKNFVKVSQHLMKYWQLPISTGITV